MNKEVMKQALEALEQWNTPLYKRGAAIETLRQAIAEAEKQEQGEPVAWRAPNWGHDNDTRPWSYRDHDEPFYPPEVGEPLYTKPQTKEWVGLTDEQIVDLVIKNAGFPTKLAKAIEAKLRGQE